eukprot:1208594-Amorphochlora_amoeboformis.AAC.1
MRMGNRTQSRILGSNMIRFESSTAPPEAKRWNADEASSFPSCPPAKTDVMPANSRKNTLRIDGRRPARQPKEFFETLRRL